APANVAFHRANDFLRVGIWILAEQSHARHDHPRSAIAALQRVGFEKGFLKRMQAAVSLQGFDGSDLLPGCNANSCHARARGYAVDEHRASSALAFPATVLAAGEIEIISQDTEQAAIGAGIDSKSASVDKKFGDPLHKSPSCRTCLIRFLCHNNKPADAMVQTENSSRQTTGITGCTGKRGCIRGGDFHAPSSRRAFVVPVPFSTIPRVPCAPRGSSF